MILDDFPAGESFQKVKSLIPACRVVIDEDIVRVAAQRRNSLQGLRFDIGQGGVFHTDRYRVSAVLQYPLHAEDVVGDRVTRFDAGVADDDTLQGQSPAIGLN